MVCLICAQLVDAQCECTFEAGEIVAVKLDATSLNKLLNGEIVTVIYLSEKTLTLLNCHLDRVFL